MIYLILGILLGSLPGFHPNLLVNLGLGSSALFEIVFGSIFSSIFPALLMVPISEMTPLLLPGQSETRKGEMQMAISKFAGGALLGVGFFTLFYPLYKFVPLFSTTLYKLILPILVFTIGFSFARSHNFQKALFIFLLSGIYGYFILNSGINPDKVLGAHFASMFGLCGLVFSGAIPKQKISNPKVNFNFIESFVGFIGGLLISLIPSFTPSQAYIILFLLFKDNAKGLSAAGSLATSSFLLSFESFLFLGKGRMATVEAIRYFDFESVIIYALFAFLFLMILSKPLINLINKIKNLKKVSVAIIFLTIFSFYSEALPIAFFSFILGSIAHKMGVERIHLMGSLILPTILFYI